MPAETGHGPAADLLSELRAGRAWIAVAESLTGGLVCDALVRHPGASTALRGGVVAYATDVKSSVLRVAPGLLAARGPVDPEVALQMADGVRALLGATWGLATTGVAGPGPAGGAPAGRVFVGVSGPGVRRARRLDLDGDRAAIREAAVVGALRLALDAVRAQARNPAAGTAR